MSTLIGLMLQAMIVVPCLFVVIRCVCVLNHYGRVIGRRLAWLHVLYPSVAVLVTYEPLRESRSPTLIECLVVSTFALSLLVDRRMRLHKKNGGLT